MLERVWRKGNPLTLLVGMQTGVATMENSRKVFQKPKLELPYDLQSIPGHVSGQNYNKKWHTHPCVHSTIATPRKQPECPLTGKWTRRRTRTQSDTTEPLKTKQGRPHSMGAARDCHTKRRESERYHMIALTCGILTTTQMSLCRN